MEFEEFFTIHMDEKSKSFLLLKSNQQQKLFVDSFNLIREYFPQCDCYTINNAKDNNQRAFRFGVKGSSENRGTPLITLRFTRNGLRISLKKDSVPEDNRVLFIEDALDFQPLLNDVKNKFTVEMEGNKNSPIVYLQDEEDSEMVTIDDMDKCANKIIPSPLNQILYGPPGTGKTYYTIEAAVKAAEPEKYKALEIKPSLGASKEQRKELTKLYKSLTDNDRIRFVTFHQSYGYEEFIEGLCAKTENGQLSYYEKDGIFKEICKDATKRVELDTGSLINTKGKVWKISIESTSSNPAKTYCYENNIAVVGWSDTGDLKNSEHNNYFNGLGKNDQSSLASFSQETNIGDLILCINSKSSVEAIGVITGAYFFNEKGVPTRPDFCHQIPVRWLAKDISVDLKSLNDSTNFHVPTFWLLSRFNVNNTLSYLLEKGINVETVHRVKQADNYVLIIDEINRGNISKIFGELITLIELSKRLGNDEALEVTLPYTGDKFSVPDNLYIIGTMNTADRSLAMMDTALRRRFDFIEMMPQPEIFKDKEVKGIKLEVLLETINKRIEVLYDREHTLGHAFLIPVLDALNTDDNTEEKAFSELKNTFKNKIIPLLEEYFFEDWNKISLVLGDNRKKTDKLAFVKTNTETYKEIFGSNHGLETYEDKKTTYTLADFNDQNSAWNNPKAYQTIYDEKVLNSLVDTSNTEENEDTATSVQ
ncbi:AAA family ATPase [Pseudoalteromonas shioyasakiensis]|uniref:AAA family ATPase n=1 Tax=Pseudoalteromonas shioyasakiensis TaxID=1190813 RepID=UPI0021189A47|nr:AAA family ATPase [Pseudoalteromonas shioyasakiensis]MCQ8878750.1 AAA family ATPase [Pseudoalteromonas shioyasakiensis]